MKQQKNQKKKKSELEKFIIGIMQQSLKATLDEALNEIFKDWK